MQPSGDVATANRLVCFDDLEHNAVASKSASTARMYSAVIKRLKQYHGGDCIDLDDITAEYVDAFGDFLLEQGVAPSSAAQFKMVFRAIFKAPFGREGSERFKDAFRNVASVNKAATHTVTIDDVRLLAHARIAEPVLDKLRSVFMFCLYGGGLLPADVDEASVPPTPQQSALCADFEKKYNTSLCRYASRLDADTYTRGLAVIGQNLALSGPLLPTSALDGWLAAARCAALAPAVIASAAAYPTAYCMPAEPVADYVKTDALLCAANRVVDFTPRWYAMRCIAAKPDEMAARLAPLGYDDTFAIPSGNTSVGLMASTLFVRCTPAAAVELRRIVSGDAYVYTLVRSTIPAVIPDSQMLTFMILCNIANDTIDCLFPDDEEYAATFAPGTEARIVDGAFEGYVGVVSRPSKDRYKVMVEIRALGNVRFTAEIPASFLVAV